MKYILFLAIALALSVNAQNPPMAPRANKPNILKRIHEERVKWKDEGLSKEEIRHRMREIWSEQREKFAKLRPQELRPQGQGLSKDEILKRIRSFEERTKRAKLQAQDNRMRSKSNEEPEEVAKLRAQDNRMLSKLNEGPEEVAKLRAQGWLKDEIMTPISVEEREERRAKNLLE